MKSMQYVIQQIDTGLQVQWDNKTILFDTQEEAEEMITDCGRFFVDPLNVEIKKGIYFIDSSINYKQLCKSGAYEQIVKLYGLKEVSKDGKNTTGSA